MLSFFSLVFLMGSNCILALDNGVALTPPMGWLQWERFGCNIDCENDPTNCISEKLFMDMADHMVQDGFLDAGYEYVNIDDCWASLERDADGKLQADPKRFPHGIKYLADYVHQKGLKLGIYGDMGNKTCGGYPGTLGHIQDDAATFAEWGIDMLKLDGCYASDSIYETGYPNMSHALNKTGRSIVYSCSWPAYIKKPDYSLLSDICNLWRNFNDISDSWESVLGIIDHYGSNQNEFQPYAGPGHWNDPDMLIIGDYGLSIDQQRAQMALWAIFASPLLMSNDLRDISKESTDILLNKEIIAVNQDPLGIQGKLISLPEASENNQVYSRPLKGGDVAVALLNTFAFSSPKNISFNFKDVGLKSSKVNIRDLYASKDLGIFSDMYSASVDPVGVRLFRLSPVSSSVNTARLRRL